MKKILITGANGQLGKEFRDLAADYPNDEFLFLSREDLPIHHYELVRNVFNSFQPDFCINCAAYTAVDKAEHEKELAFLVNAESVGVLAAVSHVHNTKFIHISTDYVYDGMASNPYTEDSITDPQSVYGLSKKMGEEEAVKNNPESLIIRTSWVYSRHGNNFVKTMMRLMNEKDSISVVSDQKGTPTWAADIAEAIMFIINSGKWINGIYNFSNAGEITWYDFAVEIKSLIASVCSVNPIPTSSYPTLAKRPQYSVLDKTKLVSVYQVKLKDWKESLGACIKEMAKS
jgi:dTDP-4-dehydrorhamnose reductase